MTSSRGIRAFAVAGAAAALIAAALIGASVISGGSKTEEPKAAPVDSSATVQMLAGIPQQGNALGRPDAPVTLVEYADVQCPYCAQWSHGALPELIRDYVRPGHVRIEFRGLAFIGPESNVGLRGVLAAGRQQKAWQMLDLLYHNQHHENSGWLTQDALRTLGAGVPGLDTERMIADSPSVTAQVDSAQRAATEAGINGTPSFQVGPTGGQLERVQIDSLDAAALRPALDAALRR